MATIRGVSNRRSAYRVCPDSVEELDLALLEKKYRLVRGNVADIAFGGAQVEFDKDSAQQLSSGDRIMLALASNRYDFDVTLWARIVSIVESSNEQIVRLSFEDEQEPLRPDTGRFFELFNRRAKYRQDEPGSELLLDASVSPVVDSGDAMPTFPAAIRNISNIGVSLAVDGEADRTLEKHAGLILTIKLPNLEQTQLIACQVRHRDVPPELSSDMI